MSIAGLCIPGGGNGVDMSVPWPLPLIAGLVTLVGAIADLTHTHHGRGIVLLLFAVVLLGFSAFSYRETH